MSNIYIQEPPTFGKVLLITTVGDIDIELWSKETPKACRNFIQLAMEGYYNNTIFHRIVKGFIAQGGDPTGTGTGGESAYGHPFKDEFHSRLRFCRRGLVAMANFGKDNNGSQFFFTFAACPELQNKHTIFGKVAGETVYNMIKLEESVTDANETPLYPQKIIRAEILHNPFDDIIPRCLPEKKEKKAKKKEKSQAGVKNFKLLSFGEEAEEDEDMSKEINLNLAGKGKSTYDMLSSSKLGSSSVEQDMHLNENSEKSDEGNIKYVLKADEVREKLKRKSISKSGDVIASDEYDIPRNALEKKKIRLKEISDEIKALKKDYQKNKGTHKNEFDKETHSSLQKKNVTEENEMVKEYKDNLKKYEHLKGVSKKKSDRESMTLELLAGFKKRLQLLKDQTHEEEISEEKKKKATETNTESTYKEDNESWLVHKLNFEGDTPVVAKDANLKTDDWFDITDPRNPINKRRREKSKASAQGKVFK